MFRAVLQIRVNQRHKWSVKFLRPLFGDRESGQGRILMAEIATQPHDPNLRASRCSREISNDVARLVLRTIIHDHETSQTSGLRNSGGTLQKLSDDFLLVEDG